MAAKKLSTEETGAKQFSSADDAKRKGIEAKRQAAANIKLQGKSGYQEFKDVLPAIGAIGGGIAGGYFGGAAGAIKGAQQGKKAGGQVKEVLPGKDTHATRAKELEEQAAREEAEVEGVPYQQSNQSDMMKFMKMHEEQNKKKKKKKGNGDSLAGLGEIFSALSDDDGGSSLGGK
tara:strand:+ start:846 stop:1370 length:525 start_codon:yes stop_codon:yes gene_type:complete